MQLRIFIECGKNIDQVVCTPHFFPATDTKNPDLGEAQHLHSHCCVVDRVRNLIRLIKLLWLLCARHRCAKEVRYDRDSMCELTMICCVCTFYKGLDITDTVYLSFAVKRQVGLILQHSFITLDHATAGCVFRRKPATIEQTDVLTGNISEQYNTLSKIRQILVA